MQAPSSSSETVIASRASPVMNSLQGLDEYRLQTVRTQGFQQNLSPSRSLRDHEASARVRSEKILKEADRPFRPSVDRKCRWRLGGEPDGCVVRVLAAAEQADAAIARQPGKKIFDRQEDFTWREYRTLSIVTPVPVPVPGVRPERLGRIVDVLGEDDHRVGREVVEQRGGLLEEQAQQVVFDARWPAPLTDFLVDRTPGRITLEAPSPCTPKRGH